ncbi:three-Cys-motif partner protein TcmP [Streptomyces sp. NPDC058424]|uniref:three-Cys-motif partner protein TcmP n=1 Tax=Streptomyces sp. NPDC058424 TaxID=3346491 RepID=UPI00364E9A12
MSTGTRSNYWADKALPSVFKHELLKRYLPQFGGMLGSQSHDKRVVYLDGYAGEGRYENGEPASAEIALRVASHFRSRHGVTVECFFTEAQQKSFERLHEVVENYRSRGVLAHAHRGEVDGVLDSVIRRAAREPLFLFLDPCGLALPQDRLVNVLAQQRPQKKSATELLMNGSWAIWQPLITQQGPAHGCAPRSRRWVRGTSSGAHRSSRRSPAGTGSCRATSRVCRPPIISAPTPATCGRASSPSSASSRSLFTPSAACTSARSREAIRTMRLMGGCGGIYRSPCCHRSVS